MLTQNETNHLKLWNIFLYQYKWTDKMENLGENEIEKMCQITLNHFKIEKISELYYEFKREYIHFFKMLDLSLCKKSALKDMLKNKNALIINVHLLWKGMQKILEDEHIETVTEKIPAYLMESDLHKFDWNLKEEKTIPV
jgi:hypothetical protein